MKKLLFFSLAALLAFGLNSCQKDDPTPIEGTWKMISVSPEITTSNPLLDELLKTEMQENFEIDEDSYVTFHTDGTGTDGYEEFLYTYSGGILSIVYPDDPEMNMSGKASISGTTMKFTVDFLSNLTSDAEFMAMLNEAFGGTVQITKAKATLTMKKQ